MVLSIPICGFLSQRTDVKNFGEKNLCLVLLEPTAEGPVPSSLATTFVTSPTYMYKDTLMELLLHMIEYFQLK